MAQRGNRPKHVAGAKGAGDEPTPEVSGTPDPNIGHTASGGGMARTSPKLRKAAAREEREAEREASALEPGEEALDEDVRTETVPGPGPLDADRGLATTKQLETHELKHPR
jgi:hypothetical protein